MSQIRPIAPKVECVTPPAEYAGRNVPRTLANRRLYSGNASCTLGCRYCFADFPDELGLPTLSQHQTNAFHLIYPACDTEFAFSTVARAQLDRLVYESDRQFCVSISQKSVVSDRLADYLLSVHEHLSSTKRGILKFSVSISTKSQISLLEPRAGTYEGRIKTLERLQSRGIPTSVNIKPILPQISTDEYAQIVADTIPYGTLYLLGGLYIDPLSEFGASIMSDFPELISMRSVEWLPGRPQWHYCESQSQIQAIRAAIATQQGRSFSSDLDLVRHLLSQVDGPQLGQRTATL